MNLKSALKGVNLCELARTTGISQATLYRYRNHDIKPQMRHLAKLKKSLNIEETGFSPKTGKLLFRKIES